MNTQVRTQNQTQMHVKEAKRVVLDEEGGIEEWRQFKNFQHERKMKARNQDHTPRNEKEHDQGKRTQTLAAKSCASCCCWLANCSTRVATPCKLDSQSFRSRVWAISRRLIWEFKEQSTSK